MNIERRGGWPNCCRHALSRLSVEARHHIKGRGITSVRCKQCDREFAASLGKCPNCGAPRGRMVHCRQCGAAISIWGARCPHCGAQGIAAYGPISLVVLLAMVAIIVLPFILFSLLLRRQLFP